jgi:hypothetical protein
MKTITQLILAGTALAAAGANAATINVLPTATGGSDLILFVTDTANNAQFIQDLGVNVDSLGKTVAGVASDGVAYSLFGSAAGTVGTINNPTVSSSVIASNGVDAALASFLSTNSGGTFVWGLEAAGTGDGSTNAGQARIVATLTGSPAQVQADAVSGTATAGSRASQVYLNEPTSTNTAGSAQTVNSFFSSVNSGTNTPYGGTTGNGFQASGAVGGVSVNALGSSMYLYELASTGGDSNFYAAANAITVSLGGVISGISSGSGSTVPLPAAIWLLGSGVLGLFGIGRRRIAIA